MQLVQSVSPSRQLPLQKQKETYNCKNHHHPASHSDDQPSQQIDHWVRCLVLHLFGIHRFFSLIFPPHQPGLTSGLQAAAKINIVPRTIILPMIFTFMRFLLGFEEPVQALPDDGSDCRSFLLCESPDFPEDFRINPDRKNLLGFFHIPSSGIVGGRIT